MTPVERPYLRLLTPETSPARTMREDVSPLVRSQSPEGRALLAARDATVGRATLISGIPGTGKSSLLRLLIEDDIRREKGGVLVVDGHGDLVADLLAVIPDDRRRRRVVLFDPADLGRPPGLNLMASDNPEAQDKTLQFFLGLFGTLYLAEHQGPIFFQAMRNALLLLMQTGGTLVELPRVFTDKRFLSDRLESVSDPWVRHYFERVWNEMGDKSRGECLAYFISKISHFVDNPVLRNVLGQTRGLDIPAAMRRGDIVLVNLARGKLGDLSARLLGCIILHLIERATVERAHLPITRRTPFHVYVDEFGELAPTGFDTLLGAARKFAVSLTVCLQRFDTLPESTCEALLGTVAHYIQFRQGTVYEDHPLAAALWPRFRARDLSRLPNFEAAARMTRPDGRPAFGRLAVSRPLVGDVARGHRVRQALRRRWPVRAAVEADLHRRFGLVPPDGESSA